MLLILWGGLLSPGISFAQYDSTAIDSNLFVQDTLIFPEDTLGLPDSVIIGVKESPPFIYKDKRGEWTGISYRLWKIIAQDLGLRFSMVEMSLNEILQNLEEKCIDLCINPLTVTSSRIRRIDFTQPFYTSNSALATRVKASKSLWTYIRQFFSFEFLQVILLLGLVIFVFGFVTWLFERRGNSEQFENSIRGVWSGIWWSAVTMTTVGYGDKSPRTWGGRFVALIWMFTAVVIISSFTASITSALTVDQLDSGIENLDELHNQEVGAVQFSASESFLNHKYIASRAYHDTKTGLIALNNAEIDVFVSDEPLLQYQVEALGFRKIWVLNYKFNPQNYSFSLPKESELLSVINPILLKELEGEEWQRILGEYDLLEY